MYILIGIILLVVIVYQWFKAEPIPRGSPIITGARGAGKTRLAVLRLVRKYRYKRFWWRLRKVPIVGWIMAPKYEPRVYSNIPLRLTRKIWADVLKREHVLMFEKLPKGATVFVDEIGIMVNQYSHGDPNIISDHYVDRFNCAEIFTRFYRHFVGEKDGDFVCTDQAVGDVNIQFRRRFDKALQLERFHRFLLVLPFYKVFVDILDISEGEVQNTKNINDVKGERRRYFFGFLPYRLPFIGYLNYSTYCYAKAYAEDRFVSSVPFDNWKDNPDGLYTNYIIELRSDEKEQSAYNARKRLISQGKLPADYVAAAAQIADQTAAKPSDETPGAAELQQDPADPVPDLADLPPLRRWLHRIAASLPRPAGRKGRAVDR